MLISWAVSLLNNIIGKHSHKPIRFRVGGQQLFYKPIFSSIYESNIVNHPLSLSLSLSLRYV